MRQLREDLAEAVDQGTHSNKYEHELRELRDALKQAQVKPLLVALAINTCMMCHAAARYVKPIY